MIIEADLKMINKIKYWNKLINNRVVNNIRNNNNNKYT